MDKKLVDVYIAALYRHGYAKVTIDSLRYQPEFGTCTLVCNIHSDSEWQEMVDYFKDDSRIILYRGDNSKESNHKLQYISQGTNYYCSLCDNDIQYAPDYLKKLIHGCEHYSAHVGLHGCIIDKGTIRSYYANRRVLRALEDVNRDTEVTLVSNCGSLWKRNWYQNYLEWWETAPNEGMDDLLVCYQAKRKGRRMMVLAHKMGYITHKEQLPDELYIFDKYAKTGNDSVQTNYYNTYIKKYI